MKIFITISCLIFLLSFSKKSNKEKNYSRGTGIFSLKENSGDSKLGFKIWRTAKNKNGEYYFWSDVPIGSGSGTLSKTSMSGLLDGDRLVIAAGSYSTLASSSLIGITWVSATSRVTLTGTSTITNCTRTTLSTLTYSGQSGIAIQYVGHNEGGGLDHVSFINVAGDCINSDQTRATYNGTTASLSLYLMTFDSLTLSGSGYLHRLNFGAPASGQGFSDSLVYTRIKIDQTTTNGEEIRGICYRIKFDQSQVTYVGTPPSSGDVGILTVYGNGTVSNVKQTGSRGYIARFYCSQLIGTARDFFFFNNFKVGGVSYGCVSPRNDPADYGTYVEGNSNFYIWNNGIYNSHDGGYISTFCVLGAHATATLHMHNNYEFDVTSAGLIQNDSGTGSTGIDSSNNKRASSNAGYFDGTTFKPILNSIIYNAGVTKSWMVADGGHDQVNNNWNATRDIGPYAYMAASPGCNLPDCSKGRRNAKGKN